MNKIFKKSFVMMQIGTVVTLCMVCTLFFAVSGCGEEEENDYACACTCEDELISSTGNTSGALDCHENSFFEGISMFSESCNVYLIKGIVLDAYEHGLNIRFVEDLKGNFPKNTNTFMIWGSNGTGFRSDYLIRYGDENVLIMHLIQVQPFHIEHRLGETWLEKPEDYSTLPCTHSVVKLSDGYVSGYLLPDKGAIKIPLKDFQKYFKNYCLKSNK